MLESASERTAVIQIVAAATIILKAKDRIQDILTTGPRRKPKARAINGGKKTRVPRVGKPLLDGPTHVQIQTNPPTIEKL